MPKTDPEVHRQKPPMPACLPGTRQCDLWVPSTMVGTCQSLGHVSLHTCFCLVMCSFTRRIVVYNPWYSCWSNQFVTWQKWLLQAVDVSWLWEAQESQEISFPLKRLQTSVWGFYFTPLGAFCAATWREMKKTIYRPVCTLTRREMAYSEVKAWSWKTKKTFSKQNSGVLVNITSRVLSGCN